MPIVRNRFIQSALADLDRFHQELRDAVAGDPPNPNEAHQYHCEPDQFLAEHRDLDMARIARALAVYKAVADSLKGLAKVAEPRNHRG
jgi:hypothetical protein